MQIKIHPEINGYEFSNEGKYRRVNTEIWFPKENGLSRYYTINYKNADGKPRSRYLHVVICELFNGKKANNLMECNHKDQNTHNNNSENLEWVSLSENRKQKANFE